MKIINLVVLPLLLLEQVSACYKCAVSYADPHIQTFDKNKFQCQGQGDFILSKSMNTDFEVQARFYVPPEGLHSGRNGSSTIGAVMYTGIANEAKIEVQVTPAGTSAMPGKTRKASSRHDCDIEYLINDEKKQMHGAQVVDKKDQFYFVRRSSDRYFYMLNSKVILWMSKGHDQVFGCYMNLQVCTPCGFERNHDLAGLLGSPDGKKTNDFRTRVGATIDKPPKMGKQTTYCKENWCVENTGQSLFNSPDIREMCASDPGDKLDHIVDEADDKTRKLCEDEGTVDEDCVTDTVVSGDDEKGQRTLEEKKKIKDTDIEETEDAEDGDEEESDDSYTCAKENLSSETAFARQEGNCFLDDEAIEREKWGWFLEIDVTHSGSYQFDVYEGAAKCDINNGKKSGHVTVSYDADENVCTGDYQSILGHTLQEFQFYCGAEKYPEGVNGKPTVAPGKYSCVREETTSTKTDQCVVKDVKPSSENPSKIYAIAHAVSCGCGDNCETEAPTDAPTEAPEPAREQEPEPEQRNADPAPTKEEEEEEPEKRTTSGSASGDPHFKTWTGDKFDYHGECDLVMVDHPEFHSGLGLKLHIRTTRVQYWSFIETVALQIGDDVLEFGNDVENFLINGLPVERKQKHHKTHLGEFVVRRDTKAISVRLHQEGRRDEHIAKIDFHSRKNGFPAIIVDGGNTDLFKGSLGLLGDWETGKRLARDGETVLDGHDATPFALEWQVRDTDPILFQEARFPQFPTQCTAPAKQNNRLGSEKMRIEAEKACAHWKEDKEDCIFDVMATRDVLVAEEGHVVHLELE